MSNNKSVSSIVLSQIKQMLQANFPIIESCKGSKIAIWYDKNTAEYKIVVHGICILIIGKKSLLSKCCNSQVLIIIGNSQLGKLVCMNKLCVNPVLDYINLNPDIIHLIFNKSKLMCADWSLLDYWHAAHYCISNALPYVCKECGRVI